MLAAHTETGAIPPYASLLAHFRNPAADSEARDSGTLPLHYDQSDRSQSPTRAVLKEVSSHANMVQPLLGEDEESKCGFSSKDSQQMNDTNGSPVSTLACAWCTFLILFFSVFSTYFIIDFAFSQYGMGTGMAQWIIYGHWPPPSLYKMDFCLESLDREAPDPQSWRYMFLSTLDECTTDTLSLVIDSKEAWKVHSGDSLSIGDNILYREEHAEIRSLMTGEEKIRVRTLGDDLAEEGQLGRTV